MKVGGVGQEVGGLRRRLEPVWWGLWGGWFVFLRVCEVSLFFSGGKGGRGVG